jgi:hypothetical protein
MSGIDFLGKIFHDGCMRTTILIMCLALCSCRPAQTKKYAVIGHFGELLHETNNKEEAFRMAEGMTSLGRILPSKPQYFVLEK